ncbi:MAG: DUF2497 domain-containing protein [Alphaproteobacteria bacterium]
MNDAAKNEQANEALDAIGQIMADMDGQGAAEPAHAPDAAAPQDEAAPVLDLTQRVNPDGTVTDLATPGATPKSPEGETRVKSAFAALREAVAAEGIQSITNGANVQSAAITAEIEPMVKNWLDQHLPAIVERVVREEVERLARRG